MAIRFESRRLYVAPRKSVLFFARMGDEKIRCYVAQDALIEPPRSLREASDVFQRCLLAFDQHRGAIESVAARLMKANKLDPDGAVIISRTALGLRAEPSIGALGAAKKRGTAKSRKGRGPTLFQESSGTTEVIPPLKRRSG
jgi:Protein of unknown function (DUF1488)